MSRKCFGRRMTWSRSRTHSNSCMEDIWPIALMENAVQDERRRWWPLHRKREKRRPTVFLWYVLSSDALYIKVTSTCYAGGPSMHSHEQMKRDSREYNPKQMIRVLQKSLQPLLPLLSLLPLLLLLIPKTRMKSPSHTTRRCSHSQ